MGRESIWTTVKRTTMAFGGILAILILAQQIMNDIDARDQNKWEKYGPTARELAASYARAAKQMDDANQDFAWRYNELVRRRDAAGVRWLRHRYYNQIDSLNNEIGGILWRVDKLSRQMNVTRAAILSQTCKNSENQY